MPQGTREGEPAAAPGVSDLTLHKLTLTEAPTGAEGQRSATTELFAPPPLCLDHVRQALSVSERRACHTLGKHRSTQRTPPLGRNDEERLTADVIELAPQYGRYMSRRVTAMLGDEGWQVNHK